MGLIDLLRRYFPVDRNETLGPNDLPSDIYNEIRGAARNNPQLNEIPDEVPPSHSYRGGFHYSDGTEFQNVFREMDSIFQSFFSNIPTVEFHHGQGLSAAESDVDLDENQSLRDKMLDGGEDRSSSMLMPFQEDHHTQGFGFKFHVPMFRDFWQSPFDRQMNDEYSRNDGDKDLDGDFESGKRSIDDILNPNHSSDGHDQSIMGFHDIPSQGFSSAFKYSTVTKKINSDGSVEATTRKRDSDGNEQVVVSRTIGDRTHSVTTKKNHAGEEEHTESFINMDQDDLKGFDEKWNESKHDTLQNHVISPENGSIFPVDNLSDMFSWWKPKL